MRRTSRRAVRELDRVAGEEVARPHALALGLAVPGERAALAAEARDEALADHRPPDGDLEDVDVDALRDALGELQAHAASGRAGPDGAQDRGGGAGGRGLGRRRGRRRRRPVASAMPRAHALRSSCLTWPRSIWTCWVSKHAPALLAGERVALHLRRLERRRRLEGDVHLVVVGGGGREVVHPQHVAACSPAGAACRWPRPPRRCSGRSGSCSRRARRSATCRRRWCPRRA